MNLNQDGKTITDLNEQFPLTYLKIDRSEVKQPLEIKTQFSQKQKRLIQEKANAIVLKTTSTIQRVVAIRREVAATQQKTATVQREAAVIRREAAAIRREAAAIRRENLQLEIRHYTSQLIQANQNLQYLACHDGLTQIANRRCFDEYLYQQWYRLASSQDCIALILCDIDYFKRYNDTYGHIAGDACLVKIAQTISSAVKRNADLVARYGGEEFVIVLPYTESTAAVKVACAIRKEIQLLDLPHSSSPICGQITLSIGIASTFPSPNLSPLVLINTADQALYQAKEGGRNCYYVNSF